MKESKQDNPRPQLLRRLSSSPLSVNLSLSCLVLVLCLLVAEVGTRLYLYVNPLPRNLNELARTCPPPFCGAEFFNEKFLNEAFNQRVHEKNAGDGFKQQKDFQGTYINVQDGLRRTTDQPQSFRNAVYFFGGSTVVCVEVPDALTSASVLQRMLNQEFPDQFIVYNYGATAGSIDEFLARLKTVTLRHGDIVIFYHGTNEAYELLYHGRSHFGDASRIRVELAEAPFPASLLYRVWQRFNKVSAFVRVHLDLTAGPRWEIPEHLRNEDTRSSLVDAFEGQYRQIMRSAWEYVHAHDAQFLSVLQPTLFTLRAPSDYEEKLRNNHFLVFAGLAEAHRLAYERMRHVAAQVEGTYRTRDFSGILDERADGQEFYIDHCHVNAAANRIIATQLLQELRLLIEGSSHRHGR